MLYATLTLQGSAPVLILHMTNNHWSQHLNFSPFCFCFTRFCHIPTSGTGKPESRGERSYSRLEGPTNGFPLVHLVYTILYYLWDTRWRESIPTTNRGSIVSPLDTDACDSSQMCTSTHTHTHKQATAHTSTIRGPLYNTNTVDSCFLSRKADRRGRTQLCDYCVKLTTDTFQPTSEKCMKSNGIIVQIED